MSRFKWNGQPIEVGERFYYFGNKTGAREGTNNSVLARLKNG